jgi:hypothetical protein
MLSNGNYAQYFPQTFSPAFLGGFGGAWPQLNPQGMLAGLPGGFGGIQGVGQDFGYQPFGQQGLFGQAGQFANPLAALYGPQGFGQQGLGLQGFGQPGFINPAFAGQGIGPHLIVSALGQLAHYVALQGVAVQQIGALLAQLTVHIAQIAAMSRAGQQGQMSQPQSQGFGSPLGQSPFNAGPYGGIGGGSFGPQTQQWGANRPVFS